jgi:hypothetical protein
VETDKKGFFKMHLNSMQYIYVNGNRSDSIQLLDPLVGEINYYYVNGRKDIAFHRYSKHKIITQ